MVQKGDSITINGKRFEAGITGQTGEDLFVEVLTPEGHRFMVPFELWNGTDPDGAKMVHSTGPLPEVAVAFPRPATLSDEVASLLNRHSLESGSDTPDFILAEYLLNCLEAFDQTVRRRELWYGRWTSATDPMGRKPTGVTGDEEPDRG